MYIKPLLEIALQCAFVTLFIRNMKSLFKRRQVSVYCNFLSQRGKVEPMYFLVSKTSALLCI